jgi:hypothetical protein
MLNIFVSPILLFILVLSIPLQANASQMPSSDLRAIHLRLLQEPTSLDLLYEYAQFAVKEGNFESAIGALEGMLIIAGNQPRVLLELGILYQRLGVSITANNYLQRARDLSATNSEVANFADEYLIEIDKQTSPHLLTGVVSIGVRYQSNPTFSPDAAEIRSGGFNIPLPESHKRESDVNAMFFSRIDHRYSFTKRFSLASDLFIYGTAYDDNTQLNFGVVEFAFGPQFASPRNAAGQFNVRPHIVLRGTSLDGSQLEQTAGAGLDCRALFGANTVLNAKYQFRDVEHKDFNNRGVVPLRSGDEHILDFRYRTEFMRGHLVEVGLFGRHHNAERNFLETEQYDISLRYSLKIDNFIFREQRKMVLTPYVVSRFIDYGGADPDIDSDVTRSDREWRLGVHYKIPLVSSWSLVMNLEHLDADSNIINYDVQNDLGMISLQTGF